MKKKKKKEVPTCWFQTEFAEISDNIKEFRPSFQGNTSYDIQCKQRRIGLFTQSLL